MSYVILRYGSVFPFRFSINCFHIVPLTFILVLHFQENANVFIVDWTGGSDGPYRQAIQNGRVAGREIAKFIEFLHMQTDIPFYRFHLMGSSLGAHVCGFAGANQPGLGRISGKNYTVIIRGPIKRKVV